jgi:hypothetical protein
MASSWAGLAFDFAADFLGAGFFGGRTSSSAEKGLDLSSSEIAAVAGD